MNHRLWKLALVGTALGASLGATIAASASSLRPGSVPAGFKPVPPGDQVNLTFLTYIDGSAAQIPTFNTLMSGFEAAHPNIHVTVQDTYPTIPAVQQDEAAGTPPDVVQGTFDGWKYLVSGLGAVDLTKTFGQNALNAEWGGTYKYAPAIESLAMAHNDVFGIPWTLSTPVLFYNANLFQKAGLNPADPPTTWQQLEADAVKIKAATGANGLANGCIGIYSVNTDWCLQAIIDSAGGKVLSSNGKRLTFDNSGTVKAMTEMQILGSSGLMQNLTSAQVNTEFASNQLAMVLNSSAVQGSLVTDSQGGNFQLMAAKLPGFGKTPSTPTNSGSALFVTTKNPLLQRAAWELIEYLTSNQSMTTITEGIGYPPLRTGLANASAYLASWKHTSALVLPNLGQLKKLIPYQGYPGPNYTQIVTTIVNAASTIAFQNGYVKSQLASAQATASSLLP